VQWRKRCGRCRTILCPLQTFTEQVAHVPAGMRTTTRLRTALAVAMEDGRDQSEVAAARQVSWPTVQRAVEVLALAEPAEPEPERVLGMDETRFGRPIESGIGTTTVFRYVQEGVEGPSGAKPTPGPLRWRR